MAKKINFPDTIILILCIMLAFIGLTWIIPAGEFARETMNGRSVLVPGSFSYVDPSPQGLMTFFLAPIKGMISAAEIIAFVFLVGGAFKIMTHTGAIDAGLQRIIQISKNRPQTKKWILPLIIILFSLGGSTFGMAEEVLVFVLITIPLALALGYDSMTGLAISFVGAGLGFAGAFINPFTIGVAQGIAELPPASGIWYRIIVWAVMTLIGVIFIMRYANKVERNPEASLVYEIDQKRDSKAWEQQSGQLEWTTSRKFVLWGLLLTLVVLVFGVSQWGWYIQEISGLFVGMGILSAVLAKLSGREAVAAFVEGAREMMIAALVIGLAKGLIVIAEDGKIIDTILNGIATASEGLPKTVTVEIMFLFQSFLNFLVPSGSGQAALTMPIMAPLSDILGISRQTAVLAFQFGDGLSNMIIPTSGVTMGILAVAKIPYNIWLKWMGPLFIILCIAAALLLLGPVLFFSW